MAETCRLQRRAALSPSGARFLILGPRSRIIICGASREARGSGEGRSREARHSPATHPNKPMHPTADTHLVINLCGAGRRVIGGVMRFLLFQLALLDVVHGVDADQDCFFLFEGLPDDVAQTFRIPLNYIPVCLPLERGVSEENVDPVREDEAGIRAVLPGGRSYRAAAEGVTQLIAEFLKDAGVNRVRQIGDEDLNAYLLG
jgi:hypothetical protein